MCGDCYKYLNMLKTFELYILNGQIVWYMNYILRKPLNIDSFPPIVLRILIVPDSHHLLCQACAEGFVGIICLTVPVTL